MIDRPFGGPEILEDLAFARQYLVSLVHGEGRYVALPLPGSATYSNEAVLAALVPASGKVLIHSNGVYGDRLIDIAAYLGKPHAILRTAPTEPPTGAPDRTGDRGRSGDHPCVRRALRDERGHPQPDRRDRPSVRASGQGPADRRRRLLRRGRDRFAHAAVRRAHYLVEQMPAGRARAWAARSCARRRWRAQRRTVRRWSSICGPSLQQLESIGAMRFTPPTQVLAALAQACREHQAEGGTAARGSRYRRNWKRLVDGMRQLGFRTVVPDAYAAPIVATFHNPEHPAFKFDALYEGMKRAASSSSPAASPSPTPSASAAWATSTSRTWPRRFRRWRRR